MGEAKHFGTSRLLVPPAGSLFEFLSLGVSAQEEEPSPVAGSPPVPVADDMHPDVQMWQRRWNPYLETLEGIRRKTAVEIIFAGREIPPGLTNSPSTNPAIEAAITKLVEWQRHLEFYDSMRPKLRRVLREEEGLAPPPAKRAGVARQIVPEHHVWIVAAAYLLARPEGRQKHCSAAAKLLNVGKRRDVQGLNRSNVHYAWSVLLPRHYAMLERQREGLGRIKLNLVIEWVKQLAVLYSARQNDPRFRNLTGGELGWTLHNHRGLPELMHRAGDQAEKAIALRARGDRVEILHPAARAA